MWTWIEQLVCGHPVFSIMEVTGACNSSGACSKSGSRKQAILSLNIQRVLISWVPQKIPKRWWPAELLMERGSSYHVLLAETGLQVCVIFCLSTDCLNLMNTSRSCGSKLTPFSTFRQSCSPAASLFILIFISCNWLSISLRDSHLLLPCQRWLFPQPWGTALGASLPSRGGERLLFAAQKAEERQPD